MWWEILKNAKLSGKAKGTSFDASKIKINLDKNDCKERLRKLIWFNITEPAREEIQEEVNNGPRNTLVDNSEFNKLPERVACNILERMKSMDLNNLEDIKPLMDGIYNNEYYKEWQVGEGYRLWLDIDEYRKIKLVRYYILNGDVDTAWIMFPFSDIKKWMAAL